MMGRKLNCIGIILIIISLLLSQVESKIDIKNSDKRFLLFISLNTFTASDKLTSLISELEYSIKQVDHPFDKVIYGYVSVFLSAYYHKNKAYSQAAQTIKKAFFYLDEVVEKNPTNWRLIYLRLRMDAFTPRYLCISFDGASGQSRHARFVSRLAGGSLSGRARHSLLGLAGFCVGKEGR